MVARTEMMVVKTATAITVTAVAESEIRRSKREPWGVKTPAEWIEENSVVRDKCVSVKRRIPIPTVAIPDGRREATRVGVSLGCIHIRFRQIGGTQTGPPVKIVGGRRFVEFLRLNFPCGAEIELVSSIHFNLAAS